MAEDWESRTRVLVHKTNAHSRQSQFTFYLQENMAQPDPLSLTLRDFITLSQLCSHLPFLGSFDPTSSNWRRTSAHYACRPQDYDQAGSNHLPESARPGLKNRAFSRLHPLSLSLTPFFFFSHRTYRSLICFRPVTGFIPTLTYWGTPKPFSFSF